MHTDAEAKRSGPHLRCWRLGGCRVRGRPAQQNRDWNSQGRKKGELDIWKEKGKQTTLLLKRDIPYKLRVRYGRKQMMSFFFFFEAGSFISINILISPFIFLQISFFLRAESFFTLYVPHFSYAFICWCISTRTAKEWLA